MKLRRLLMTGMLTLAFLGVQVSAWRYESCEEMGRHRIPAVHLSKAEQMKEMEWFMKAAAPFKGMEIKVVSETIPTHEYESKVLAKAFYEITGIKVTHDLIQEGDVIEKLQVQVQSGENVLMPTSTTPTSSAPTSVPAMQST